ncbi:hypothetical protein [Priestia megaterium]|uniref:hypothetical protein n=1 Tax=Priestia megaterium TaxID=1404 RepID=UPI001BEAC994|nr:hypothetical protein [Priestia megaterium]MBT2259637.1 hypothetical protein [Priestia megaterium]MBT2281338.1 hypothetical protein [Priestia megaterium]
MKKHKKYLLAVLILPWFSIPLLGKRNLKRFFLPSLIINLIVLAECFLARKRTWWYFYKSLHPKMLGEIPLLFGPFLVGTMWIFKFTYGNFRNFMITNFILDAFFVYILMSWFKKIGYGSMVRLKRYHFLLIFTTKAAFLYGLQKFISNKRRVTS